MKNFTVVTIIQKLRLSLFFGLILACASSFAQTSSSLFIDYEPHEVIVQGGEDGELNLKALCTAISASIIDTALETNTWLVRISKNWSVLKAIDYFQNSAGVIAAQPNYYYPYFMDPNDVFYTSQWNLNRVNLPFAWDITNGDADTVIAIIDSGVDMNHPDLVGKLLPGYDFGERDSNPMDNYGHGTRCAGVAAGATDNGMGISGAGFNCKILPLKASDAAGNLTTWGIAQSIWYAPSHKAKVVSMSFGRTTIDPYMQLVIQYSQGRCVFIAAAGNSGSMTPTYPAAYPGVISVGGSTMSDLRHPGSNFGPWVRVAAPGVSIFCTDMGGGYGQYTGTSYAAPLVAGLAGLAMSTMGTSAQTGPGYVQELIEETCDQVGAWVAKGRVNALSMLNYVPAGMLKLDFYPSTIQATYGALISGTPTDLRWSDDQRVRFQAAHYQGPTYVVAGNISVSTTIPGLLKEIQISIENRKDTPFTTPFSVRLWRWSDSTWVFVGSTVLTSTDKTLLYRQIYNPYSFVSQTGEIKVGFQADSTGQFEIQPDCIRVSTLSK